MSDHIQNYKIMFEMLQNTVTINRMMIVSALKTNGKSIIQSLGHYFF